MSKASSGLTMDLQEINARWVTIGHPHAVLDEKRWHSHCPGCGKDGPACDTLLAAMNNALSHKVRCQRVS